MSNKGAQNVPTRGPRLPKGGQDSPKGKNLCVTATVFNTQRSKLLERVDP